MWESQKYKIRISMTETLNSNLLLCEPTNFYHKPKPGNRVQQQYKATEKNQRVATAIIAFSCISWVLSCRKTPLAFCIMLLSPFCSSLMKCRDDASCSIAMAMSFTLDNSCSICRFVLVSESATFLLFDTFFLLLNLFVRFRALLEEAKRLVLSCS